MRQAIIAVLAIIMLAPAAFAGTGLVTKKSTHSVAQTLDRLEGALKDKGIVVFARIDHAAGAKKAGMHLRPTELLIFGNPKLGTPLIESKQTIGIDLPLKVLAWEDENGQVWLTYNAPAFLVNRHGITDRAQVLKKMTGTLHKLTDVATKP
ncbi:MAG: DUF302 domain-containing protein [Candidatus Methylomirabilales bacterium]